MRTMDTKWNHYTVSCTVNGQSLVIWTLTGCLKNTGCSNSKRYMHPNVHSSAINNSQDMEATYVSIDRWMDKEAVVYIHNVILLSHKKEWNNVIWSNMNGPGDYHSKWRKSERERDKCHMVSLMCGIFKNDTNELIYKQKQTHRYRKQTYGYQRGKRGEGYIRILGLTDMHHRIWYK